MVIKKKPTYYLKTVGDALEILDVISNESVPIGITELSRRLDLNRSKVHRILDTLKYWGYIEQETSTRKYILGSKVLWLAMKKLEATDLIKIASPFLDKLVKELGGILDNNIQPVYLEPRKGDVRDSLADVSKARDLLGYNPEIKLKEGLEYTIRYFSKKN